MNERINKMLDSLTHAYQPIVNIHTGKCIGFEALLRNFLESGFENIDSVFNYAYANDSLFTLDINLRKKAIQKIKNSDIFQNDTLLFYNLDNRTLTSKDYEFGKTIEFLDELNISPSNICFEVSEKHYLECSEYLINLLNNYKKQGFSISIDDFGVKFSGLEYIYNFEPDYVKIDRFFISDINKNHKKRLFVEHIISLCSKLGIKTIAEGIETLEELKECKEMGFNFAQGYFIEKPQIDLFSLKSVYEHINEIKSTRSQTDTDLILENLKSIEPININESIINCLYRFKDASVNLLPVVDNKMRPIGVITEKDLKNYAYSPYGKDLLTNKTYNKPLSAVITKAPIVCATSKIEDIIESFVQTGSVNTKEIPPVLVVQNEKYIGCLDAATIINIVHKYNLVRVSNQNPLTKLPGNNPIKDYIQEVINKSNQAAFIYFDIDKFKVYNDTFGFRQGDRIILFLSDILQKTFSQKHYFVGHIGGDDFFVGCDLSKISFEEVFEKCIKAQDDFNYGSKVFYPKEIIDQGYIKAKDRDGIVKNFGFVSVSFAILHIAKQSGNPDEEKISKLLALLKKQAKSLSAFSIATLLEPNINLFDFYEFKKSHDFSIKQAK
ncbi:MAG: EAL domain-containing protein [Desulfurella sp.]